MKKVSYLFLLLLLLATSLYFLEPKAVSEIKGITLSVNEFQRKLKKAKEGNIQELNYLFFYFYSHDDKKSSCSIIYKMKDNPKYNNELEAFYKGNCYKFNISSSSIDMLKVKK